MRGVTTRIYQSEKYGAMSLPSRVPWWENTYRKTRVANHNEHTPQIDNMRGSYSGIIESHEYPSCGIIPWFRNALPESIYYCDYILR